MNIAVFGCSNYGKIIMDALKVMKDIKTLFFIDNSVEKIGTEVDGVKVISLYLFASMYQNGEVDKIIIPNYSMGSVKSMKSDLRKNEVKSEDVLIVEVSNFIKRIQSLSNFSDYTCEKLPYIQYLSFEAAEKCNLNCKRCDHFSNLCHEENCESVEEFKHNVELLASKIESIGNFSFLGGEPLLNERLDEYVYIVKQYYPDTQIIILTNGILLRNIDEKLIKAVKENDVLVRMTLYPPLKNQIDDIVDFMREKNIRFELSKVVDEFWTQINPAGDSDPTKMLNRCANSDCYMFKQGKLAKCPITMNSDFFNNYFGDIIPKDILDLEDKNTTIERIRDYVYNPISACAYCGQERFFDWEQTTGTLNINEMKCTQKV